jgi:regulator of replication initiation timing
MVERRKAGKKGKSTADDASSSSENMPDVGGLTASLDALMAIADTSEKKAKGEVVRLSSRKTGGTAHRAVKKTPGGRRKTTRAKPRQDVEDETLGVVELLGALKSDIDSLRKDNDEFKARLMSTPAVGVSHSASRDDDSDVRGLLEALKADIGNLRHENDFLRSQAFAMQERKAPEQNKDHELYQLLAELKQDIVSLRTENDALRQETFASPMTGETQKTDQVALMLQELKADISELKHENESLRLENLTARDGARFENFGGQQEAYRNNGNNAFAGMAKLLGVVLLVVGATGGGYYFAKMQGGEQSFPDLTRQFNPMSPTRPRDVRPLETVPRLQKEIPKVQPVKPPVIVKATPKVKVRKISPVAKAPGKPMSVSAEVETAMIIRADGLMEARDLGAARMVFVYLARHGSAVAMTRLAQTYDPQYLDMHQFDGVKNGDPARARRLYGAASKMGDKQASERLKEME